MDQNKFSRFIPAPPLPDNTISSIISDSGINLSDKSQEKVKTVSIDYLAEIELLDGLPRNSQTKKAAEKIKKQAKKLFDLLDDLDDYTAAKIRNQLSLLKRIKLDNLKDDIYLLSLSCSRFQKRIPIDKGGRNKQLAIRRYIKCLGEIYYAETKDSSFPAWNDAFNDTIEGKFFEFVDACLHGIECPPLFEKSLCKIIREVREDLKDTFQ